MKGFLYNNSYLLYLCNKVRWKLSNFIAKYLLKDDANRFKIFKKSQKICIWCKRTHNKKDENFCSKKCNKLYNVEKFQIFKHNNRCCKHKYQILTYKNICWSCYIKMIKSQKVPRMKKRFLLTFFGFKVIPTFRTSKETWNGDKIAFEQFLKDRGIKWFVYIKFYEIKTLGKIKPIVAGKSGSIKVNSSGSDLSFSTDVKHGISKQFLSYNKFDWHYEHIMIRKCKNE